MESWSFEFSIQIFSNFFNRIGDTKFIVLCFIRKTYFSLVCLVSIFFLMQHQKSYWKIYQFFSFWVGWGVWVLNREILIYRESKKQLIINFQIQSQFFFRRTKFFTRKFFQIYLPDLFSTPQKRQEKNSNVQKDNLIN